MNTTHAQECVSQTRRTGNRVQSVHVLHHSKTQAMSDKVAGAMQETRWDKPMSSKNGLSIHFSASEDQHFSASPVCTNDAGQRMGSLECHAGRCIWLRKSTQLLYIARQGFELSLPGCQSTTLMQSQSTQQHSQDVCECVCVRALQYLRLPLRTERLPISIGTA